jgi:cytoskeleton protein RodZ
MEPIGEKLKNARLEKGLTLEDVHKKTKIHLNVLKGIEEGSLVNFSPVYIKGFLKIYCKFLGIEYSDSLVDHKQARVQPIARPVQEKKKAALPVADGVAVWQEAGKFIRSKIKIILVIAVIFVVSVSLFNLGKFISSKVRRMPKRTAVTSKAVPSSLKQEKRNETQASRKALAQKPAAAILPKPEPPQKPEEAAAPGVRLGIRAKEDCWLQVRSDGKTIFQNILKKGRFENWQAKEKIELSLGNAGVVELEVNGKFISSLGRRGQAVKNILITKDGLATSR